MSVTRAKDSVTRPYNFALILSGEPELTEDIANALIEAGCDDATLGSRCGVITLEFTRRAESLQQALSSAMADVARSGTNLRVLRVEPDELVTIAEIARRIGQSRESVRLYALGRRGPGNFPPPLTGATQKTALYRWSDVATWVSTEVLARVSIGTAGPANARSSRTESTGPSLSTTDLRTIGAVNAALELGRYVSSRGEASAILREVLAVSRRPQVNPVPSK